MSKILLLGAKSKLNPLESVPSELNQIKHLFSSTPNINYEVEYEPYLTRSILGTLLRNLVDQIDIIHFAGHSGSNQLQTDDELVYSSHIASILESWDKKPSLLFINGCNNAGQVENFLDAGILCVIATHNYIDDHEATLFAREFYACLISKPDKMTLNNAFKRASSTTLMVVSRKARSLDITTIENINEKKWDWGLFSNNPEIKDKWTLNYNNKKYTNFESEKKSVNLSKIEIATIATLMFFILFFVYEAFYKEESGLSIEQNQKSIIIKNQGSVDAKIIDAIYIRDNEIYCITNKNINYHLGASVFKYKIDADEIRNNYKIRHGEALKLVTCRKIYCDKLYQNAPLNAITAYVKYKGEGLLNSTKTTCASNASCQKYFNSGILSCKMIDI